MKQYKLGVLGLGKMGGSIVLGIDKAKLYSKDDILLYDKSEDVNNEYKANGFNIAKDEAELFTTTQILILAIKPQMFPSLIPILKPLKLSLVVVSIAAGITIDNLSSYFGKQKFIRVMPNTPAIIASAASAIARGDLVDDQTFTDVKKIFESIGIVEEIKEEQMDVIIPANGSMPAYVYYFAQAFIDQASEDGIPYEQAKRLAGYSIIGSMKLMLESEKSLDQLIKDVCSPGGTTIAGLNELTNNNFQEIIKKASIACVKRSKELGKM